MVQEDVHEKKNALKKSWVLNGLKALEIRYIPKTNMDHVFMLLMIECYRVNRIVYFFIIC